MKFRNENGDAKIGNVIAAVGIGLGVLMGLLGGVYALGRTESGALTRETADMTYISRETHNAQIESLGARLTRIENTLDQINHKLDKQAAR